MQLAQVNVARLRAPLDAPAVAGFVAAIAAINQLADHSPGFVWRLPNDEGHVTTQSGDSLVIVNLSVWQSYTALHHFVYRSDHGRFVRQRSRWFQPQAGPTTALWWVPVGHEPSITEATARLQHLKRYGPAPSAFSLRAQFDQEGRRIRRSRPA